MLGSRFYSAAILGCSCFAVAYAATGANAANLLLNNPDFESPGTDYSADDPNGIPGWIAPYDFYGFGYSYYGISNDVKMGQSGAQFAYFEGTKLQTADADRAIVTAGTTYDLTANIRGGDDSSGENVTLSIVFFDSSGMQISSADDLITLAATSTTDPFINFPFSAVAPTGAATAAVSITDPYGPFSGHSVFADNFVLTAAADVPEPASLSIAAFAIGALGRRRRKA